MPNENSNNLEKQKLLLEKKQIEQEKELKLKELEILNKQVGIQQWTVPIVVALIGGILGLLSNFWNNQQSLLLEKEKMKGNLILEAIKTDPTKSAANLIFLADSKLIDLTEEQRKSLKSLAGENPLPSLPQSGYFTPPIVKDARIFLLTGKSEKFELLYKLRAELINAGFTISGVKSIDDKERPNQAEVRYFNDSDRLQSEIIAESIRSSSKEPTLTSITAKIYKDLSAKAGYIEIWVGK